MKKRKRKYRRTKTKDFDDFWEFYTNRIEGKEFIKTVNEKSNELYIYIQKTNTIVFESIITGKSVLKSLFRNEHIGKMKEIVINVLQNQLLLVFYHELLEEFLEKLEDIGKFLEKTNQIKWIICKKILLENIGILDITGLVIDCLKKSIGLNKKYIIESIIDEKNPDYEELMLFKHELIEMQKSIDLLDKPLFNLKL
ncbi:MAG: hypothetical protein FK730_01985 [Asgard group archaeon]|nr:hypothetical protein [Asgard group archaeon]